MDAPPYSPAATGSERQLPANYWPAEDAVEHEDPLESLFRGQESAPSSPLGSCPSTHRQSLTPSLATDYVNLYPVATAPASSTTFPSHITFTTSFEPPPKYAPVDELARSYRLDPPFIYTTRTSNLPRYQLMQEFSRSGRPKRLHIRRLMATEARSHSLPTSTLPSNGPLIRYDDDATMYTMNCYEIPGIATSWEMRGHRSSTLRGIIKIESGKSLLGGRWTKVWHVTKNAQKDSLNVENEARMQKYGYHSHHELDKRLLFNAKRGVWVNGEGKQVGRETKNWELEVLDGLGGERWKHDLMVTCWVMRIWMGEGLRWANDVKGW